METEGHTLQDREANSIMVLPVWETKYNQETIVTRASCAAEAALGDSKQTMMGFKSAPCTKRRSCMDDGKKCWEAIAESGGETV